MKQIKSSHNESVEMKFDAYTFLAPIIHNIQEEPIIEEILNSEMINYYYILAIVLCVMKSPHETTV